MKRLLWIGDLAPTGFGTVTWDTGREMIKMGVDVRFVSQNDIGDLPEPYLSRTLSERSIEVIEPNAEHPHGELGGINDVLAPVVLGQGRGLTLANGEPWGDWKPDAVFLLGDFYGFRLMAEPFLDVFRQVPTFHYVPVEGHDLPPLWADLWKIVKPIAMTEFGQDEIEKIMGYRPPMVYHGVNPDDFWPVSPSRPIILDDADENGKARKVMLASKTACKVFLTRLSQITLVLRADRNMPRKGYPSLIRAMAPVMRERPMVVLGLHTRRWDQGGLLDDTISKFPDVAGRIWTPEFGHVPREILNTMYNAADVYVSTSAEGFGLTIAEALACGTPAVGIDYSAVPEVIGPAGVTVPVAKFMDNEYGHHWALPDEDAFGNAVAHLIDHPHKRMELGRMGPAHVERNFRWDVAAERFLAIAFGETIPDVSEAELVAA